MSTQFPLVKDSITDAELCIDERSGRLNFYIDEGFRESRQMEPEEAIGIALRIIQIAFYNIPDDADRVFAATIEKLKRL